MWTVDSIFVLADSKFHTADGYESLTVVRYWVGGSGNVSDTNHWSQFNGGAPGASLPTATVNCYWTALSNPTAYTTTVDSSFNCADMMFEEAPATSGTITLAGSGTLASWGSVSFLSGMTSSHSGTFDLRKSSGTGIVTTNGVTLSCSFNVYSGSGTIQLGDNLTINKLMVLLLLLMEYLIQTVRLSR